MTRAARNTREPFLRAHITYKGDDCVIWPFAKLNKKGYGSLKIGGRQKTASRWMCILAHGEPPGERYEAAHSCGNSSCINPRHIRWATQAENIADREAHGTTAWGTRTKRARLSPEAVRSIRTDTRLNRIISAEHGISMRQLFHIKSGESWRRLE